GRRLLEATPTVIPSTQWLRQPLKLLFKRADLCVFGFHEPHDHDVPRQVRNRVRSFVFRLVSALSKVLGEECRLAFSREYDREVDLARERQIVAAFQHPTKDIAVLVV